MSLQTKLYNLIDHVINQMEADKGLKGKKQDAAFNTVLAFNALVSNGAITEEYRTIVEKFYDLVQKYNKQIFYSISAH